MGSPSLADSVTCAAAGERAPDAPHPAELRAGHNGLRSGLHKTLRQSQLAVQRRLCRRSRRDDGAARRQLRVQEPHHCATRARGLVVRQPCDRLERLEAGGVAQLAPDREAVAPLGMGVKRDEEVVAVLDSRDVALAHGGLALGRCAAEAGQPSLNKRVRTAKDLAALAGRRRRHRLVAIKCCGGALVATLADRSDHCSH
mmetsp:Transcript_43075/g.139106  ORF Transcript_43075/g.139106 Transcript_43075/m.139106 type:complete len:200 (-) Transcript_43075:300-899(-)